MQLVKENQIHIPKENYQDCTSDDISSISTFLNLNQQEKSILSNEEICTFIKNNPNIKSNPYIIKEILNYPALFNNTANTNDILISLKYQKEFQDYENKLQYIQKTEKPFIYLLIFFIIIFLAILYLSKITKKIIQKQNFFSKFHKKICPYCCSKIPVGATRCPHCTSELRKRK